ncbi:MAG TPA: SH3 domain-containing protein [Gammaproteobacteria bacterium]
MSRITIVLAGILSCLPLIAFADEGAITRATQLLAAPYVDAGSRGMLERDTPVEVIERDGGWYRVKADDGREGWVRLSSIRLGQAAEEEEGGFWASLFSFTGRTHTRTASATTGIRGLSETEILNARPDPAAVARLAGFSPSDKETKRFAAEIGLQARDVKALPEEIELADAKGGGQ